MSKPLTQQTELEWYSNYRKFEFFAVRARTVEILYLNKNAKILVAGCGYGYLVEELASLGYTDVWGCDISTYCFNKSQEKLNSTIRSKIKVADITNRQQLNSLKSQIGLSGNSKCDLIITEDVMPCLETDNEIQTAKSELARIGNSFFHIITCSTNSNLQDGGDFWIDSGVSRIKTLNWKTKEEWKSILGGDTVLSTETGEVI